MSRHAVALAVSLAALAACTTTKTETLDTSCQSAADCDDGVFCNGVEACSGGACLRGTPPACGDGVSCTVDLCNEAQLACVHVPDSGACGFAERCVATGCEPAPRCALAADCDDGLFCNGAETCGGDARCHPGTAQVCDDAIACTVDFCDDLLDRCAHVGDAWACEAGERCSPAAGCVAPAECAADGDCDDGLFCNGAETCDVANGVCTPGVRPDCDDAITCTVDLCDELLARCVSIGDAARCAAGESCSPTLGCLAPRSCAADAACDDGVFCNGAETCDLGAGRCLAGTPPACGDAVACNVDLCDEAGRACLHLDEPAAAGCTPLAITRSGTGAGTVTSTPVAIDCGTTCSGWFAPASAFTLSAAPDAASTFAGWSGACTGTGPCAVTMSQARAATATFTRRTFALTVNRTGAGTVASAPAGIYCGAACQAAFDAGTTVTLTAMADATATFVGWGGGACTGTSPTCTLTMDGAKTVSATFQTNTFSLSVSKTGAGTGNVTSSDGGISCGGTCTASYAAATVVTLDAAPWPTSEFAGWSGACTGTGACTVTMSQARNVTAQFNTQSYAVNVTRLGPGTVTSTPAGISCGTTCSATFGSWVTVTLTAAPDAGATFAGWAGACSGTGTCTLPMTQAQAVTAVFEPPALHDLLVLRDGTGGGTVTSTPAGISCGATCLASFQAGSSVTLTATPDASSDFAGWAGACTGTGTCNVPMDGTRGVVATFTRRSYALTVNRTGAGTVTSAPAGIYCGAACAAALDAGTMVTLTATPDPTTTFVGWTGACSGTSLTCTMMMNGAKTVSATFVP